jgi:hypothetical protein
VQVFKVWKVLILKKKIAFIAFIEFIGFIAFIEFIAFIKNNITKEWTNPLIPLDKVEKDNGKIVAKLATNLALPKCRFLGRVCVYRVH